MHACGGSLSYIPRTEITVSGVVRERHVKADPGYTRFVPPAKSVSPPAQGSMAAESHEQFDSSAPDMVHSAQSAGTGCTRSAPPWTC